MPNLRNAYALIIGIANYQYVNPLPVTVLDDARAIHASLTDESLCAYQQENVTLLLNEAATQSALRQALADLKFKSNADSTVFIYVSSHGGRIESGSQAGDYLLPVNVHYADAKILAETSIRDREFTAALSAIPAVKMIVVLDCCHAGGIGRPKDASPTPKIGLSDAYLEKLKIGRGRVILASSRSTELSWILPGARNSLFTEHLLSGLI